MSAPGSKFSYVTFIRTTPGEAWKALTDPQLIARYWYEVRVECRWERGAPWKMYFADGRLADAGEVLEADPPRRLAVRWQCQWNPELHAEGPSLWTVDVEDEGGAVKLTLAHELDRPESRFIQAVSGAWPRVLSNLKSLLETGDIATRTHGGHA